ncbi:MAG TPA: 16S rRNA (adenine(1518)-N(6)/adenine(1519)-N(6))-dimethyltransferase RsmA [Syntrophales bacterium]|nr:16S rRNA (adenine(1518)-N(6)/adenine(1519)-N(6))-dimethyltransferase RsmA [Syntrophales bacterium]
MTTVRKILRDRGIRPLKRLGQSFLEDKNVINKILKISDLREDDTIIEIGAGIGIMTEMIAQVARKVIALEVDPRMVGILKERLAGYHHVDIVQTDVLEYNFCSASFESPSKKTKVIGNIPYNISSQILFHLLTHRSHISSMILMFQKELADRLVASPGTKEYGIPTVLVSMYTECSREMVIPRSCFYPKPEVISAVMKIIIRDKPLLDLKDDDFFFKIVKIAFSKRRKTLLNNIRSSQLLEYSESDVVTALKKTCISGMRRGETLTAEELGKLSNALHQIEIP